MSPKAFLVLATVTLITTVAAVFAVVSQPAVTTLRYVDQPAFPALRENPDAVARITLTAPAGKITLVRETGDRWSALERYGYPVDRKRVRDLVVALADMRLIERKTAQPERYGRLQVEAPEAEKAQSQLVRLETADGKVLAEAIIGKQRYRLTGTEPSGTYLRRPKEAQSWLASGGVQIEQELAKWLDGEIVQLDPAAIRRIEIARAGEPGYVAERAQPGDPLRLAGLADNEALKDDAELNRLTGALADVRLDDVKPRDQLSWPAQQHTARIQTFDGVELTVRLAQIDDQYWATFDARAIEPTRTSAADTTAKPAANAPAADQQSALAAAAAEQNSASPAGGGQTTAAEQDQSGQASGVEDASLDQPAAPEQAPPLDADQLNQRLGKWAYRIPEHLFNRLSTARAELVKARDGTLNARRAAATGVRPARNSARAAVAARGARQKRRRARPQPRTGLTKINGADGRGS